MKKFLSLSTKSLELHGVSTHKELWHKAQSEGCEGLSLAVDVEITKEVDGDTKKFHAVFSTEAEDRHGEIVFQDFELKAFKKNPVYLDSHNYGSIEHIIGRVASISIREKKLQGQIEFATFNPKGKLAEQLAEEGYLNTSSIGFIPKAFDDKGNILKSELLEISAVSVPANAEALFDEKEKLIAPASYEEEHAPTAPAEDQPEPVTAPLDVRAIAAGTVRELAAERARTLNAVARALNTVEGPTRKRQILKSVRDFIQKADIAA